MNATYYIERMLSFALRHSLIEEMDTAYARNGLLDAMKLDAPEPFEPASEPLPATLTTIIEPLEAIAAQRGLIEDTEGARERFGVRLSGIITPPPGKTRDTFRALCEREGPRKATDWFYGMCRATDYIRVDHILKNVRFTEDSPAGPLEITINLSKPEKDPRDIALALTAPKVGYPSCMLCQENPGYAGRAGYPARQNHRIVPVTLAGENFYLQYSPYLYYEEHSIVLNERHVPMKIDRRAFQKLFDFVDQFPHYMIGSNADLPIVGGSILSHDHFQGGAHVFPMEKAKARAKLDAPVAGIEAQIVDWPMSCVRLTGEDALSLIGMSVNMLDAWRGYSDEGLGILAMTDQAHNTITPILRREGDRYTVHLVLRNNRVSPEHPLGIFHPHADLHHVKKENIGLIEVMGLFILPGRLLDEFGDVKEYLTGARPLADAPTEGERVLKHYPWVRQIASAEGTNLTAQEAENALRRHLAVKCARVLADAGVYKKDEQGTLGFIKFLETLGYRARV